MTRPRIMSLCSGYGGLTAAVEEVTGGETVAFAEYDPDPSRILAHHWPHIPNLHDINHIDWQVWAGQVDIIDAGYPCQPFSHAGKRAGEDDPPHLWPAVLAGVRALRPRLVLLENVAGHLSGVWSSSRGPGRSGVRRGMGLPTSCRRRRPPRTRPPIHRCYRHPRLRMGVAAESRARSVGPGHRGRSGP